MNRLFTLVFFLLISVSAYAEQNGGTGTPEETVTSTIPLIEWMLSLWPW
jgi:hypothetical protein